MFDPGETVKACRFIWAKHSPLWMAVGGDLLDGESNRKKYRRPLTEAETKELLRRYTDLNEDTHELAAEFNLSIYTLRNIASQRGVKRPRYAPER